MIFTMLERVLEMNYDALLLRTFSFLPSVEIVTKKSLKNINN